jgi:hypothetical protein
MLSSSNALVLKTFSSSVATVVFIVEDYISYLRLLCIWGTGAFTQLYRRDL